MNPGAFADFVREGGLALTGRTPQPWTVPAALAVLTRVSIAMAQTRTVPQMVAFLPSGCTQLTLTGLRDITWADRFLAALFPDADDRPVLEHTDGVVRTDGVRVLRFDAGDPDTSGVCLVAFVEVGSGIHGGAS